MKAQRAFRILKEQTMKSHAIFSGSVILVALAYVAIDSADLRGQKNVGVPQQGLPSSLPRPGVVEQSPAAKNAAGFPLTGNTNTTNQKALLPLRTQRSTTPNYDPTRNAPLSPKTNPGRSIVPQNAVTTANVQSGTANVGRSSTVTPAGHQVDGNRALNRDGLDVPPRNNAPELPSLNVSPGLRATPPGVRGSILGLQGESILELSIRLKQDIQALEQQNDDLRKSNSNLQARYDESQNHLVHVIREVQSARKDLEVSRNDLERLRGELQNLQDKIRVAQKEHNDLLQSMGPLLQQMLESDEISSLPPSPME